MNEIISGLVSIIIPVYKVEDYLERCFQTAVNQTYKNIEIILVDDGSPDRCGELCEELAKTDDRVKVVHKENGGLSSARNAGMEIANGEFYYFLDSDDYIEANLVEKCVNTFQETNADMVAFNFERIYEEPGNTWQNEKNIRQSIIINNEKQRLKMITNKFLKYKFGFEAWNRMYKAEIILHNKLEYAPNKLVFSEDICFNLEYLMYANRIEMIEDILYYYLVRKTSIMGASKHIVKVEQFTKLANYVYDQISNNKRLQYIKNNFYIIFNLLLDNQLMNVPLEERRKYLIDSCFLKCNLQSMQRNVVNNIMKLNVFRGVKYSVLSKYYLLEDKKSYNILKRFCKL